MKELKVVERIAKRNADNFEILSQVRTKDILAIADAFRALEGRAEAAEAKLIPDGWKLVPVEPTEEMLRAWRDDMYKSYAKNHIEHIGDDEIGFAWTAMITAAPTPHD